MAAVILGFAGATGCLPAVPAPDRPDIVLISLDTLRADHLSLYGYSRPTSPELDRFAAQSCVVFERSISTSTWTLPTHATMLTGLLPREHGLTHVDHRLSSEIPTVAELLRDSGYETSAVTDGVYLGEYWGLVRGFTAFQTPSGNGWEPKDARRTFSFASREVDRLRRSDRPFFLFVHTYETHQPYVLHEEFSKGFVDPDYRGAFEDDVEWSPRFTGELPAGELRRIIGLYDGEVRRLDHYLGPFLEDLRGQGGDRRTVVVITSDHGEAFGESGTYEHGLGRIEDENVVVPLLVCELPDGAPRRSTTPTTSLDLTPTILELAGARSPFDLLGDALVGLGPDRPRWAFAHGFNSFPWDDEEWIRLEGPDGRLQVDLRHSVESSTERGGDEELRARALLFLARGRLTAGVALIPPGFETLRVEPDAPFSIAARVDDTAWTPVPAAGETGRIQLDPAAENLLFLRGVERTPGPPIRLTVDGETLRPVSGATERASGTRVNPVESPVVPRWLVFENGVLATTGIARPDEETIEAMRSLGYL